MRQMAVSLLAAVLVAVVVPGGARAAAWVEGTHYARLTPPQQTSVPAGKVELLEVFSYACPVCNTFQPVMAQLQRSLPEYVQFAYLPAAFNTAEDWPMFQRAFFAAQFLGIVERTHQAMYDTVWKSGELAVVDPASNRLKDRQPTIEDAARFYARVAGVNEQQFLTMAKSFGVDSKMRAADAKIQAMQVPGTPALIVNGKYRVIRESLKTNDELIQLVKYLVALESPTR